MKTVEETLDKILSKVTVTAWWAIFSALLIGVLVHSQILYSDISYRDDIQYHYSLGETYESGRWGIGLIEAVKSRMDFGIFSMNAWNGMWAIFWIAFSAFLIMYILEIKSKVQAVLIGTSMVVFPVVTSTFAYMFTAHIYFGAMFLATVAVFLCNYYRHGWIPAIVILTFATGIYQAYLFWAFALCVVKLLYDYWNRELRENLIACIKNAIMLLCSAVAYFGIDAWIRKKLGVQLNGYQGLGQELNVDYMSYARGILDAYKASIRLAQWDTFGLSNNIWIRREYGCLYLLIGVLILLITIHYRKDIKRLILWCVILLVMPLSVSGIFILENINNASLHTLMCYSYAVLFIYPFAFINILRKHESVRKNVLVEALCYIASIDIICILIFNAWLDNAAYQKADTLQRNADAYCTELITAIRTTPGYTDELPVAFVNLYGSPDDSIATLWEYGDITLKGYQNMGRQFTAFATWEDYLRIRLGYTFVKPDNYDEIIFSDTVREMPIYPDDGSIQIVDGVIVVNTISPFEQ